ncbi:MAG: hypothetical protein UW35_C0026G0009 [Candidatus Collierbacteria bacterium GW2011_GWF2_44_15]|nr:MAG: hypothetical protein UW23_C0019G0003 [Candidatus Collierbacteria bacterium GW2011_GWA1_44_12]KKT37191.1 MAG: hypothetical protein UW26_C0037G0008 [Candidatus Collierbacteria bacterium GW2011_GWF1_44_12]KKT45974.1 MAG: hypothetical protein UW35_C0026G0009 [Candidatus Collierbacteria bacterium GW2011_GWF2_44_15]KKT98470.1 MAG: hypothetical protein UW99_C0023G0008 [Candidatus Collierbacteria bacterium GW2011_GWC2_45_15]
MASGKGVVADYLKAQGFAFESLSDRIREDMKARNIPLTRENLQNYGNYLREAYGNAVLAQRTVDLLSDSGHNVCIDSIRNPGELLFLRESLGALIIGIDAPEDLRLVWYLERAQARGEDFATAEDFYTAAKRDLGQGEAISGQQVSACLELSDFILVNRGSKEELYEQMSELLGEIKSYHPEKYKKSPLESVD